MENAKRVVSHIPNIEKLYGKTILITGGTGMICSAVADVLFYKNATGGAGIKVVFAGRDKRSVEQRFGNKDWEFIKFDAIQSFIEDTKVDYVIYGASNADPSSIAQYPVETIVANTTGLNDIIKHVEAGRYLYISSSEIYGNGGEAPYKEDGYGYVDILNPRASYPSSKRLAETLCAAYAAEYDKNFVIVRPGHIYGPTISARDSRASAQFSRSAAVGQDIVMKSDGAQLRSYCYVYDCASAILTVLVNGEKGGAYNISNKDSICTIKEMSEALAKAGGVKVVIEDASDDEKKSYNLMIDSSLDATKLESLGWRAEYGLEEGAQRTVAGLKRG